jgi:diacylglycerol O-acyltransferase
MQRLSGFDASFLYMETPTMHMHVGFVAVLDPRSAAGSASSGGKYDAERVSRLIEQEARRQPRLRKRLIEIPLNLDHPFWIDDPAFDPIHHVRRVTCAAPGGPHELSDLVGRILSTPLDRSRPLWEMWIVESLADGCFALIAKAHHAIADGMSGTSLISGMFSLTPDGPPIQTPVVDGNNTPDNDQAIPEDADLIIDALRSRFTRPQENVTELFKKTQKAWQNIVDRRASGKRRVGASLLDAPRTPWNAAVSAQRVASFVRVPQAELKTIRSAFSVSVHDVVLALCAGTLRRYLELRGELPGAPLIAACPVATRKKATRNNHVSALFTSLATNLEDPVARLVAIRSSMRAAKEEHSTFGGDTFANWAEVMPPMVFSVAAHAYSKYRVAERHRPLYNLAVSNVPGPPVPLYLAGARLVGAYPFGPLLDGVGLNITVMSYAGNIDFGFMAAGNLIPDVWTLAELVPQMSAELIARAPEKPQQQQPARKIVEDA